MMKLVRLWINLKVQKGNNHRCMKTFIISIFIILFGIHIVSGQNLLERANAEYDKDRYADALQLYLQVAKEEGISSDLYYNIGNTYYRMGDLGHAILYYERALILDPQNDDARTNLEFVNTKIQTRIVENKSFVAQEIDNLIYSQTSNTWAVISVVSFIIVIGGVLMYIFTTTIILRKIGFFGGGIMLLISIISIAFSFVVKSKVEAGNQVILIKPSVTLSTVPRVPKDKNEEAFILTAGNKVTVVDSVENHVGEEHEMWYDVKADATHRAWLKRSDVEKI